MCYINKRTAFIAIALSVVTVIALGLAIFTPVAHAETPFDITCCYAGEAKLISGSKELTVLGVEVRGIFHSNHENKALNNMTLHCIGVFRIMSGKGTSIAYCKGMDPDGDVIVQEHRRDGPKITWKFLQGTGKYKGITGGGTGKVVARGKPITPGTTQGCSRVIGTFQMPK